MRILSRIATKNWICGAVWSGLLLDRVGLVLLYHVNYFEMVVCTLKNVIMRQMKFSCSKKEWINPFLAWLNDFLSAFSLMYLICLLLRQWFGFGFWFSFLYKKVRTFKKNTVSTDYSFWDRSIFTQIYMNCFAYQFISWTNWVNSG